MLTRLWHNPLILFHGLWPVLCSILPCLWSLSLKFYGIMDCSMTTLTEHRVAQSEVSRFSPQNLIKLFLDFTWGDLNMKVQKCIKFYFQISRSLFDQCHLLITSIFETISFLKNCHIYVDLLELVESRKTCQDQI